ncbi:MAG: DUF2007 domain-containing protein [Polyangiaceae bacterium]
MICVFRGSDYLQAQLLTGLLQQHGIDVFLQGAALQGALGELPALGHLALLVDEQDEQDARLVLAAYERGDLALDDTLDEENQ